MRTFKEYLELKELFDNPGIFDREDSVKAQILDNIVFEHDKKQFMVEFGKAHVAYGKRAVSVRTGLKQGKRLGRKFPPIANVKKFVSTLINAVEFGISLEPDQKVKQAKGYAIEVPALIFDRYQKIILKILFYKLRKKFDIVKGYYESNNENLKVIYVVKKGQNFKNVFDKISFDDDAEIIDNSSEEIVVTKVDSPSGTETDNEDETPYIDHEIVVEEIPSQLEIDEKHFLKIEDKYAYSDDYREYAYRRIMLKLIKANSSLAGIHIPALTKEEYEKGKLYFDKSEDVILKKYSGVFSFLLNCIGYRFENPKNSKYSLKENAQGEDIPTGYFEKDSFKPNYFDSVFYSKYAFTKINDKSLSYEERDKLEDNALYWLYEACPQKKYYSWDEVYDELTSVGLKRMNEVISKIKSKLKYQEFIHDSPKSRNSFKYDGLTDANWDHSSKEDVIYYFSDEEKLEYLATYFAGEDYIKTEDCIKLEEADDGKLRWETESKYYDARKTIATNLTNQLIKDSVVKGKSYEQIQSTLDELGVEDINRPLAYMSNLNTFQIFLMDSWLMRGGTESHEVSFYGASTLVHNDTHSLEDYWYMSSDQENRLEEKDLYSREILTSKGLQSKYNGIYLNTQKFLREKFKKKYEKGGTIKLYRGIGVSNADKYVPSPLESWSTLKSTANKFADMMAEYGKTGTILVANVPYTAIWATYETMEKYFVPESDLKGKREHIVMGGVFNDIDIFTIGMDGENKIKTFREFLENVNNEDGMKKLKIVKPAQSDENTGHGYDRNEQRTKADKKDKESETNKK